MFVCVCLLRCEVGREGENIEVFVCVLGGVYMVGV